MRIFDPQNTFFRAVSRVTDVAGISLLWAFCAVPLVTLTAATAALYESVRRCIRTGEDGAFACFFSVLRSRLRPSALSSLLWCGIWAGLLAGGRVLALLAASGVRAAAVQLALFCALLIVPAGTACWLPVLFARRGSGRPWEQTLLAARLTLSHLPASLALTALTGLSAYLCWRWWFPVLFLPALCALVCSAAAERVLRSEGLAEQQ
jgi:hypothetical protein